MIMEDKPDITVMPQTDLQRLFDELWETNQTLKETNQAQKQEIEALKSEIEKLKGKQSQHSQNSSKPPSSDGYAKSNQPRSNRKKTNKKPGGQKGRAGKTLKQVAHPDHVSESRPEQCHYCSSDLSKQAATDYQKRQVFDWPETPFVVTEYRSYSKPCGCCGKTTQGAFPEGVTQSVQYGARVRAMSVYMNHYHMMPYRRISQLFEACFGMPVASGTLVKFVGECVGKLQPSIQAIQQQLIDSAQAHFDETGIRVAGQLNWLHVASTRLLSYYEAHTKRGQQAMDAMGILPVFKGIATHDHWKSYFRYDQCAHSLCNAHHLRELTFAYEHYQQPWARRMHSLLRWINRQVQRSRARNELQLSDPQIERYQQCYRAILSEGFQDIPEFKAENKGKRGRKKQHPAKNLWDRLYAYEPAVLYFMKNVEVPFTNNQGERDLRMTKVKEKVSGCFRSAQASQHFARIKSVMDTAQKQGVKPLEALIQAFQGQPFMPDTS